MQMYSSILPPPMACFPVQEGSPAASPDGENHLQDKREGSSLEHAFVRKGLHALSEGKLLLCREERELPALQNMAFDSLNLSKANLRLFRERVAHGCAKLHMSQERSFDFITAVAEACMNAVFHAKQGEGRIGIDYANDVVQCRIDDKGNGISEDLLHRASLEFSLTHGGPFGNGFPLMIAFADRIWLRTGRQGTTIMLEQCMSSINCQADGQSATPSMKFNEANLHR